MTTGLSIDQKRALITRKFKEQIAEATLHRLFEMQAARTPDSIAVSCGESQLNYRDLDAHATRMALRLRAEGVRPESLVGLCAERSIELIVGLLAILKAGAAYVPLDPTYPTDRLAFQVGDSGAAMLLVQPHLRDRLPAGPARIVELPALEDEPATGPWGRIDEKATGGNLAYVIYTSGSTGAPKGVPVTHRNVTRLFSSTRRWFGFGASDVWTLFHSFAFDFSVWEIWGALLHGGRLVIVPHLVSRSPESFRELLRSEQVTVLNQTPSAFRQLIRADETAPPGDLALRWVIFGGEALELQSLRPWFDRHGDATPRLVNMYGITETTVHVTYRPITRADLEGPSRASPIGRPIPDLRLYVLDGEMELTPIGAVGEAYVGGEGVARGYLDRPALTAQRFIPDPFSNRPGARLYRSGDLVRVRPGGEFEYVGRADRQVKLRGFRIELGEIEAALARQPEVREAAVIAAQDPRGDTRLVAYLVPRGGPALAPSELRSRMKRALPDYMVPSAYVTLPSMPLTANGKLDAEALPPFDWSRSDDDRRGFVAPRTPIEELIAGVWSDVLGVERVGALDDFFSLGGHSLLATQVISRLCQEFGFEVPLRDLLDAPTVSDLAARIESARPGERGPTDSPITPVARDGAIALSYSQQALWFLDRLAPGAPTFNVTAAVRISGPLDVPALARCFQEIVRRHESLRTTFPAVEGRPVQVISPDATIPLPITDLGNLPQDDREAEARRLAVLEARTPFDLESGPLVRARILRLGDRDHVTLMAIHHIVTDGWSMGVAARELAALYEAFTQARPSPLPDLPIQYADFAAWQRKSLQGDALEALLAYWSRRLEGLVPLSLPTDRPRPAVRSSRGDVRYFSLSPELSSEIRALGRREGATVFMTILAAFQELLGRYSGQEDFAVGVPVANRSRPEIEGLIGYFVNMLVLRSDLSADPSFRTLLDRVRRTSIQAFEHQALPFDRLVEAIQPARDPSRTPLFDVMFVHQNNRMPDASRQELTLGHLDVGEGTGTSKFDLTLCVVEGDVNLYGSLEFNTDLFDGATIERMIGRFKALLDAIVAEPDRPLSELSLIEERERELIIEDWNRTAAGGAAAPLLHRLVEARARRTPDAVAVVASGRSYSYRELDERSNRLAHDLRSRGVGPEDRVGLCIDRSIDLAIGMLGILKAGGAYVPLDPGEPGMRAAAMLEGSGVSLVLTTPTMPPIPEVRGLDIVRIDAERGQLSRHPASPPEERTRPNNAAYVIFTSGSTGSPRGVVVPHQSVANHALAVARLFGLGPGDRVLQFSSLQFDIAVEEIFPTWISGAALVFREGDGHLDHRRFTESIAREGITVLDLPTAYWHSWVDWLSRRGLEPPRDLRLVVVGGERASSSAYATWRELAGDRVRWINTYGPTEATVIATAYEPVGRPDTELPIGRPIDNVTAYVLDRKLRPVPAGLPGELYLGGMGVSRGYLGQPAATALRFIPDPFGKQSGARLFRTGDLARWRPGGQLEFLGRVDFQAKVRGFRVEPGEVEATLLQHPDVRAAVVVARAEETGDGRLDAFVVLGEDCPGTREHLRDELRRFLTDRLPAPMVPSSFTAVDCLPLTAGGKVDRRALIARASGRPQERGDRIDLPRDEVEAGVAAIWEELLQVRPIGRSDSFFDLGGHSLLAIRMLARVEQEFGREIPVSSLFLGSTIADIAARLRGEPATSPGLPLVPLQPAGGERPFFCVHPAGGIAYCFLELAGRMGRDRPFFALQASGLEPGEEPALDLREMARRYLGSIRRVQPEGPYHLGGYSMGGLVAFEMARQLEALGEEVATLAIIDAHAPIRPPRPRASILMLAREAAALPLFRDAMPWVDGRYGLDDVALVLDYLGGMSRGHPRGFLHLMGRLRPLGPDDQLAEALKLFGLDRVYHRETRPDRVRRLWSVLCANLLAAARYAPEAYPGRITLFRAGSPARRGGTMGWARLAASVDTHVIPGDHASILQPPAVDLLGRTLISEIKTAEMALA